MVVGCTPAPGAARGGVRGGRESRDGDAARSVYHCNSEGRLHSDQNQVVGIVSVCESRKNSSA
jgi:hypothetical protein